MDILYVTDEYLIPNHGHQHANTTVLTLLGGFLQELVAWQQVFVPTAGSFSTPNKKHFYMDLALCVVRGDQIPSAMQSFS